MRLEESSIFVSLKQLRDKLYQAQFLMDKSARIVYGTPLMQSCGNALRYFVLAFTVKDKKCAGMETAITKRCELSALYLLNGGNTSILTNLGVVFRRMTDTELIN